eukprot:gene2894-3345_t
MADNERVILESLFYKGHKYQQICEMMKTDHNINLSLAQLKRKLKQYNLRRNKVEYNRQSLRNSIMEILDGPGSSWGYRSVWHALQQRGIRVPRKAVEEIVREVDPDGVATRKSHKLRRREYICPGPNEVWHADGYDKLKPFGFPIHGCIDGYSRKVLWLYITRSNNLPDNIAAYYLETVRAQGGCPKELYTDLGTENGIMAGVHSFFTDDVDSHKYVPSPRNQRIEGCWSFLKKSWSSWWISFFKDLESKGDLNMFDPVQKECLWFCFAKIVQTSLDEIKNNWNIHYIRKSRFDTVSGRPDALYTIPEFHGGISDLIVPVTNADLDYAYSHLVEASDNNSDYEEHFQYVIDELQLTAANDWKTGLDLYKTITNLAVNGI